MRLRRVGARLVIACGWVGPGIALLGVENGPDLPKNIPPSHVIHEHHGPGHTSLWARTSRVDPLTVVPVRIGLQQSNLEQGRQKLLDISDPESANYGKHLSLQEVTNLFAPHQDSVASVKEWLITWGISEERISRSMNKQWIQFDASIEEVENLLFAEFHNYEQKLTGTVNIACSGYHVPENVQHHIDYITPGIKLMPEEGLQRPKIRRRNSTARTKRELSPDSIVQPLAADAVNGDNRKPAAKYPDLVRPFDDCLYDTMPECIRAQYGMPKGSKKHPKNKLGIFQGLNLRYWQGDLDRYFSVASPEIPEGTRPTDHLVNGAIGETDDPDQSGGEAVMDFQLAMALIWPQETILWHVDDEWHEKQHREAPLVYKGYFNNLFNAMDGSYCNSSAYGYTGNCDEPECLDPSYPNLEEGGYEGELMCGAFEPTNVLSISYSGSESSLPAGYQKRQCDEIMKLGLQGVTVLVSSGDLGVGSHQRDPPPMGCLGRENEVFNPSFLSNCPYVLSVGGTTWKEERRRGPGPPPVEGGPSENGRDSRGKDQDEGKGKDGRGKGEGKGKGGGREKLWPDPLPDPEDGWIQNSQGPPSMPPTQEDPNEGAHISKPGPPRHPKRQAARLDDLTKPPYTETAPVDFESGGGFSNVYEAPPWQANHTERYFARLAERSINLGFEGYEGGRTDYQAIGDDGRVFNLHGRGYPDVAAIGDNIYVVQSGEAIGLVGTSASTPIVGSMINLINEERLAVGKTPVGFIHPVLYAHPEIFYDVTVGANPSCMSDGFRATDGWDPVTGLGSPNFPKMLELFMALP